MRMAGDVAGMGMEARISITPEEMVVRVEEGPVLDILSVEAPRRLHLVQ